MRNRIAIAALAALIGAGSLLGALAKPALAADHQHRVHHHHHAYQNNGRHAGWNNGRHVGWNNGQHPGRYVGYGNANRTGNGTWVNGKYYPSGNQNRWNTGTANQHHHHHRNAEHYR